MDNKFNIKNNDSPKEKCLIGNNFIEIGDLFDKKTNLNDTLKYNLNLDKKSYVFFEKIEKGLESIKSNNIVYLKLYFLIAVNFSEKEFNNIDYSSTIFQNKLKMINEKNIDYVDIFMLTNDLIIEELFKKSLLEYRTVTNQSLNNIARNFNNLTGGIFNIETKGIKRNYEHLDSKSIKYIAGKISDKKLLNRFITFQLSEEFKYLENELNLSYISIFEAFSYDFPFEKYKKFDIEKNAKTFDVILILFIRNKENLNNFKSIDEIYEFYKKEIISFNKKNKEKRFIDKDIYEQYKTIEYSFKKDSNDKKVNNSNNKEKIIPIKEIKFYEALYKKFPWFEKEIENHIKYCYLINPKVPKNEVYKFIKNDIYNKLSKLNYNEINILIALTKKVNKIGKIYFDKNNNPIKSKSPFLNKLIGLLGLSKKQIDFIYKFTNIIETKFSANEYGRFSNLYEYYKIGKENMSDDEKINLVSKKLNQLKKFKIFSGDIKGKEKREINSSDIIKALKNNLNTEEEFIKFEGKYLEYSGDFIKDKYLNKYVGKHNGLLQRKGIDKKLFKELLFPFFNEILNYGVDRSDFIHDIIDIPDLEIFLKYLSKNKDIEIFKSPKIKLQENFQFINSMLLYKQQRKDLINSNNFDFIIKEYEKDFQEYMDIPQNKPNKLITLSINYHEGSDHNNVLKNELFKMKSIFNNSLKIKGGYIDLNKEIDKNTTSEILLKKIENIIEVSSNENLIFYIGGHGGKDGSITYKNGELGKKDFFDKIAILAKNNKNVNFILISCLNGYKFDKNVQGNIFINSGEHPSASIDTVKIERHIFGLDYNNDGINSAKEMAFNQMKNYRYSLIGNIGFKTFVKNKYKN